MSATRSPPLVVLAVLALALALASPAQAATQDPGTFPDGVAAVRNTPARASQDFAVEVELAGAADSVTITVCRFASAGADAPEVCFMNAAAKLVDGVWSASTSAASHPAWKDGWHLGYKVTVKSGGTQAHAPDRLSAVGEPDYYRVTVGADEPAAEGTAVVEDTPEEASDGTHLAPAVAASSEDAPALPLGAVVAACALALALRRRPA